MRVVPVVLAMMVALQGLLQILEATVVSPRAMEFSSIVQPTMVTSPNYLIHWTRAVLLLSSRLCPRLRMRKTLELLSGHLVLIVMVRRWLRTLWTWCMRRLPS